MSELAPHALGDTPADSEVGVACFLSITVILLLDIGPRPHHRNSDLS